MNISEVFSEYLIEWCKVNHKPCPKEGVLNHIWQKAWQEFMETYLVDNWKEIKQDYLDMPLLTNQKKKKLEQEKELEKLNSEPEQEESLKEETLMSDWEKVQKLL